MDISNLALSLIFTAGINKVLELNDSDVGLDCFMFLLKNLEKIQIYCSG